MRVIAGELYIADDPELARESVPITIGDDVQIGRGGAAVARCDAGDGRGGAAVARGRADGVAVGR